MANVSLSWSALQPTLLPWIEEIVGPLTDPERVFVRVCELCPLSRWFEPYNEQRMGRPRHDRVKIAKAMFARSIFQIGTVKALLERLHRDRALRMLCGWETVNQVPRAATFSRVLNAFALDHLLEKMHEAMVKAHFDGIAVGHLCYDSSEVVAREKKHRIRKPKPPKPKKPRGRKKKGVVTSPPAPTRLELQATRRLDENLADLPTHCDRGGKTDSKGNHHYWIGYKLHTTVTEHGIPVAAVLTSASVNDSQVMIPLMQMAVQRLRNYYDVGDAAYDAKEIKAMSRSLNHVPIIDVNKRNDKDRPPLDPATKQRYKVRTAVERTFGDLENYGKKSVRVRGPEKVMTHLMFGVVILTTIQIARLFG